MTRLATNTTPNLGLHAWAGNDRVLREEINDNFADIDAKAHILDKQDGNAMSNTYKASSGYATAVPSATAVFIDDDGDTTVLTKLRDIAVSKGIPWTISLFDTSLIVLNNLSDTLSLQNDLGWEIAAHSDPDISGYTEQQVDDYAQHITSFLRDKGFILNNYIYSHGGYSDITQKILSRYFRSASTTGQSKGNDFGSMSMYRLNRIEIPYSLSSTNDLATLKGYVDTAFTKNQLILFTTHIWGMSDTQIQIMKDLIDYIVTKGIKITTLNKALDEFAPVIYSANAGLNPTDYFFLQRNGSLYSNRAKVKQAATNTFLNSNPITDFELNMITVNTVNTANATGFPNSKAGVLTTFRLDADNSYGYQTYQEYGTKNIHMRKANSSGTWGTWYRLLDSTDAAITIQSPTNSFLASNVLTDFTVNRITVSDVNTANGTGMPSNSAGTLMTYRLNSDNSYGFQLFQAYASRKFYIRKSNSDGTWGGWFQLLDDSDARHRVLSKNMYASSYVPSVGGSAIYSFEIDSSLQTGYANNSPGVATLYTVGNNIREEYRPYQTNEVWSRYVDGSGNWTSWVKISAV